MMHIVAMIMHAAMIIIVTKGMNIITVISMVRVLFTIPPRPCIVATSFIPACTRVRIPVFLPVFMLPAQW